MVTTTENPNLDKNGKLKRSQGNNRRLGLRDPQARLTQLDQDSQKRANEVLEPAVKQQGQEGGKTQSDLPLDAGDRAQLAAEERENESKKKKP